MRSALPIFAMVALCLFIVIGVVMFGYSLQSADAGVNGTGNQTTTAIYTINYAWFGLVVLLGLVLALAFAWWHFFG